MLGPQLSPEDQKVVSRIRARAIELAEQTGVFRKVSDDTDPYQIGGRSMWRHTVNDPVWEFDLWREEYKQMDEMTARYAYGTSRGPRWFWRASADLHHWLSSPYDIVTTAIQHSRGNFIPNTGGWTEHVDVLGEVFEVGTEREHLLVMNQTAEVIR